MRVCACTRVPVCICPVGLERKDEGPGIRDQGSGIRDQGAGTLGSGQEPGMKDKDPGTKDQRSRFRGRGPGARNYRPDTEEGLGTKDQGSGTKDWPPETGQATGHQKAAPQSPVPGPKDVGPGTGHQLGIHVLGIGWQTFQVLPGSPPTQDFRCHGVRASAPRIFPRRRNRETNENMA